MSGPYSSVAEKSNVKSEMKCRVKGFTHALISDDTSAERNELNRRVNQRVQKRECDEKAQSRWEKSVQE